MKRLTTDMVHFEQPIPVDVFNKDGRLLAKAGSTLASERLYRELLDFGYVDGEPDAPAPSGRQVEPVSQIPDLGILIADDTPLMLDMLEKSLRGLGAQRVLRAEDGEIALARIGRYAPEVVFLDIDMPRRDGISALKELRAEFPTLFVCMLSAHSSVQNVREAMSAGASAFLVKPFQTDKLMNVLVQYIKKFKMGEA